MLDWLKRLRATRAERKLVAWHAPGRPVWPTRDPSAFAREGYAGNAIAYRCVRMIAEAAASAPFKVGPGDHPLARLLSEPNPEQTGVELMEAFYGHLQVAGNAYLEAASIDGDAPSELYVLRPDRMSVIPGADGWPVGWEHRAGSDVRRFERDPVSNLAPILHLKLFNPSDARPFPAFPARRDVWSDGAAWRRGHWLNGRAGLSGLAEVVLGLCARAGVHDVDVSGLVGAVSGYVVDSPSSARDAIEPLMAAYDFSCAERAGVLVFSHRGAGETQAIVANDLTADSVAELHMRRDGSEAPAEARVRYLDAARDYQIGDASARRVDSAEARVGRLDAPLVLEHEAAEAIAQRLLADGRTAEETLALTVRPTLLAIEPGDVVSFAAADGVFEALRIEEAEARTLHLRRVNASPSVVALAAPNAPTAPAIAPTPVCSVLDIPLLPGLEGDERPLAALFASPWLGLHDVHAGVQQSLRATARAPAIMGELIWALWPGPVDRWDEGNRFRVKLFGGALASASREAVLNGANLFAIKSGDEWEIIQAARCELVGDGEYELSGMLRGCLGSAHAMAAPHPVGSRIVALDQRLARLDVGAHEWNEALTIKVPPAGAGLASARAAIVNVTLPHAAARQWPPAHLRARRVAGGDISISWVRRARIGGDAWSPGEPPLGTVAEGYVVEIGDGVGVVRTEAVDVPSFVYSAADQIADFGALAGPLQIRVAQMSESGASGLNSELTITL